MIRQGEGGSGGEGVTRRSCCSNQHATVHGRSRCGPSCCISEWALCIGCGQVGMGFMHGMRPAYQACLAPLPFLPVLYIYGHLCQSPPRLASIAHSFSLALTSFTGAAVNLCLFVLLPQSRSERPTTAGWSQVFRARQPKQTNGTF